MEGQIAKFIIPMLKNQTVNSNPHELVLCRVKGTSSDLPLVVSFLPSSKYTQPQLDRNLSPSQFYPASTETDSSSHPLSYYPVTKYLWDNSEVLPWERQFLAPKVRRADSKCPRKIHYTGRLHLILELPQGQPPFLLLPTLQEQLLGLSTSHTLSRSPRTRCQ